MKPESLHKGNLYNYKNQPERLVFMGRKLYPGDSRMWFQFAKVKSPDEVWVEIFQSDLHLIEETQQDAPITTMEDFKAALKLAEGDIASYTSQRLYELQKKAKVEITGVTIDLITSQALNEPFPAIGGATAIVYFKV